MQELFWDLKQKGVIRLTVKVASSFISPEQALINLDREIGGKDFETVKKDGREVWNKELGRIAKLKAEHLTSSEHSIPVCTG